MSEMISDINKESKFSGMIFCLPACFLVSCFKFLQQRNMAWDKIESGTKNKTDMRYHGFLKILRIKNP